ncbi:hypothetical protein L6164_004411 [Bauhinia variegata]|uniref:Uncharacterized protein n=1 Tax=Bauhinia variegata TaxID=167791 RepID=A0ACB9Q3S2_BAUVA|nr:hypothetical protein L6164_004411 [Bauhinia variegata]
MRTCKIGGINVDFPFESNDCQLLYMEKVIQSLEPGNDFYLAALLLKLEKRTAEVRDKLSPEQYKEFVVSIN